MDNPGYCGDYVVLRETPAGSEKGENGWKGSQEPPGGASGDVRRVADSCVSRLNYLHPHPATAGRRFDGGSVIPISCLERIPPPWGHRRQALPGRDSSPKNVAFFLDGRAAPLIQRHYRAWLVCGSLVIRVGSRFWPSHASWAREGRWRLQIVANRL